MPKNLSAALDTWAAEQPDAPGRPEAIRRVLTEHLGAAGHLGLSGAGPSTTKIPAEPVEPIETSMASPIVAGLAAVLIERATAQLGEEEAAKLLRRTIADLDGVGRELDP